MVCRNEPVESPATEVTVQTHGKDKYARTLGDVILPDGMSLNQELVKKDWCWWHRKNGIVQRVTIVSISRQT